MSELNPVRIAVIGAGAMGRNHIRFVTEEPEAELVAIADAFEGARATAEAAGVPFYTDSAQMMDEVKPEAVIIATPNDLHLGVAREAVKRNIVPLVEKPISNAPGGMPRPSPPRPRPPACPCSWVSTVATTPSSTRPRRSSSPASWASSPCRAFTT